MKVTALIPDPLVHEIEDYAHGKNLTESLVIALSEWLALKKIAKLGDKVVAKPLKFIPSFSAERVRYLNRKR
jgi:hypothetical protein